MDPIGRSHGCGSGDSGVGSEEIMPSTSDAAFEAPSLEGTTLPRHKPPPVLLSPSLENDRLRRPRTPRSALMAHAPSFFCETNPRSGFTNFWQASSATKKCHPCAGATRQASGEAPSTA